MFFQLLMHVYLAQSNVAVMYEGTPQMVGTNTTPNRTYCRLPDPVFADGSSGLNWGTGNQAWNFNNTDKWKNYALACGGNRQSPINIVSSSAVNETQQPIITYLTTTNNSFEEEYKIYTQEVAGEFNAFDAYDRGILTRYYALQFHTHIPSEHKIDNSQFDMEIHFVHLAVETATQNCNVLFNKLAVFALLFTQNNSTADYPVFNYFFDTTTNGHVSFNLSMFLQYMNDTTYYHYNGSLTTPPCTQTVNWYVFAQPLPINNKQYKQFQNLINDPTYFGQVSANRRPIQDTNNRTIYKGKASLQQTEYIPADTVTVITPIPPSSQATYSYILCALIILII